LGLDIQAGRHFSLLWTSKCPLQWTSKLVLHLASENERQMDDENDDDDETKKIKLSEKILYIYYIHPFSHRTLAVKLSDLPLYQLAHLTYSIL
jgi:hypothetical protein